MTNGEKKANIKLVPLFETQAGPPCLIGLARLAALGRSLAEKRCVEYRELPTRRYITRCRSARVPFRWTVNPYRGCEFGCKYCYARYTHEFLELRGQNDFETKIFTKEWNPQAFRQELGRIPRRDWIAIGTATDPYQPAERRFGVAREMLRIFAEERGRRLSLTTKSALVRRDVELIRAVSAANVFHVAVTITTMDEQLALRIEPYAPRPELRMEAVQALTLAGVPAGVTVAPILPLLTDSEAALDRLGADAAGAGACSFGGGAVFLKPCTHAAFFPFLAQEFPHLLERYRRHFQRNSFLPARYQERIETRLAAVRRRHGLAEWFPGHLPELWEGELQLELGLEARAEAPVCFAAKSTCR